MRNLSRFLGVIGGLFGFISGIVLAIATIIVVFFVRNPFPIIGPQPKIGVVIGLVVLTALFLVAGVLGFTGGVLATKEPRRAGTLQLAVGTVLAVLALAASTLGPIQGLVLGGWAAVHLVGGLLALMVAPKYESASRSRGRLRRRRNPFFD